MVNMQAAPGVETVPGPVSDLALNYVMVAGVSRQPPTWFVMPNGLGVMYAGLNTEGSDHWRSLLRLVSYGQRGYNHYQLLLQQEPHSSVVCSGYLQTRYAPDEPGLPITDVVVTTMDVRRQPRWNLGPVNGVAVVSGIVVSAPRQEKLDYATGMVFDVDVPSTVPGSDTEPGVARVAVGHYGIRTGEYIEGIPLGADIVVQGSMRSIQRQGLPKDVPPVHDVRLVTDGEIWLLKLPSRHNP
jgi:hypothetical protein